MWRGLEANGGKTRCGGVYVAEGVNVKGITVCGGDGDGEKWAKGEEGEV